MYDITKLCTCCGAPRPCSCELLEFQEYIGIKDKPTAAKVKKSKKELKFEGDK